VEPLAYPICSVRQLTRQRRTQLQLRGGQHRTEAQLGGRTGDAGQEQGAGLVAGHAGQPGAVAVQQLVAAGRAAIGVNRDAGGSQGLHVAVDGAHRDLELVGQFARRHPAPGLQQQQERDETTGAHLGTLTPTRTR
jgi:hypothetical protein